MCAAYAECATYAEEVKSLDDELRAIDKLRAPTEESHAEITKRCTELLARFEQAEDQARIYYIWARTAGQSLMMDPDGVTEHARAALALPLALENRLELYVYLGDAVQRQHRGTKGEELRAARSEAVVPYFEGLSEGATWLSTNETVVGDTPEDIARMREVGSEPRDSTDIRKRMRQVILVERYTEALKSQIISLYSKQPFNLEELTRTASVYQLPASVREDLLVRVKSAMADREARARGAALNRKATTTTKAQASAWPLNAGSVTLVALIAIGAILLGYRYVAVR
jgi:hypothetical protein